MKRLIYSTIIAFAITNFISCKNASDSTPKDTNSTEVTQDTIQARGHNDIFENDTTSSNSNIQSKGFGRCHASGCYCKAFEGRGQTCRNCGHAYSKH